ncbi:MAG: hypothetical protein Q8R30_04510 [bacterium]|nr:hypothetical protein [bacterium]MDZ4285451.1 hypothetical protein [Candidatus Sungbacteria bacterium]
MQRTYELQRFGNLLQIRWGHQLEDYQAGDCLVVVKGNKDDQGRYEYLKPMTREAARAYIAAHIQMLGSLIHDCRGLIRDDEVILFECSVHVRNHG